MKKILFICSESSPGLRDYAIPILEAMKEQYDIYALFVDNHSKQYTDFFDIRGAEDHYIHFRQPENKLKKIFFRLLAYKIYNQILLLCTSNKIDTVWMLTGDSMLSPFRKKLNKKFNVIYTVHDLEPHEMICQSFLEKLKFKYLFINRERKLRETFPYLVSNSHIQVNTLKSYYPLKQVFYHNFPSLVNPVHLEEKVCPELLNVENYILFFGRIEKYKGIEYLYNAFINSQKLQKYKLVIAGSGFLYFERNFLKEQQVIFINRIIEEEEIPLLFKNAVAIVYPYISATQSGVMSIAYYYNKPLLLSDIDFFKDNMIEGETALSFKNADSVDLEQKLCQLLEETDLKKMKEEQQKFYEQKYEQEILKEQLANIINCIENKNQVKDS
jgi:glycosyltransferase involved in cell wall biosynthesis